MIVCKLWGGIGNQLFQYAYCYALSKKYNQEMFIDTSYYKRQNLRTPRLNSLMITNDRTVNENDMPYLVKKLRGKFANKIIRVFPDFIFKIDSNWIYFKETRFTYKQYNLSNYNKIYVDGYWQCEKYFAEYAEEIKDEFRLKNELSNEAQKYKSRILNSNSISIHIRRGDYTNLIQKFNKHLYILDMYYYKEAIEIIKKKVDNPIFFIFSDDIDYAVHELGENKNYIFIKLNSDYADIEELSLMSLCKHNIVANSTFSWWGAWLNCNNNKIVISPSEYFGNKNIIPKEWLKVKVKRLKKVKNN